MADIQDRMGNVFATTGQLTCKLFPRNGENCVPLDLEITPTARASKPNLVVISFAGDAHLQTSGDELLLGRVELRNAIQQITGNCLSPQQLGLAIPVGPCFQTLMERNKKLEESGGSDKLTINLKECSMATILQDEKTGQLQDVLYTQISPLSVKL